jgi:ABC-type nitrate/sulfonate/bicarbonate transport system substrate-binding protein
MNGGAMHSWDEENNGSRGETMNGRKRSLWTILLVAIGGLMPLGGHTLAAGTATQRASLVLDWTVNPDHGGIFTAIQRGIFRRHRISMVVHVPSDTSAQIPLVAAGRADFGISYETDLLNARARGIPVQSVMCIMQHPLDTVMALRSSGIKRPRDLQGRTVGMAGSPSDIPIVTAMVTHDGGSMRSVRMVNIGYSLLPALLAKKVDAVVGVYWTWEAIQARAKGDPVNVMRVERWGVPNYCELVLVASERTIRTRTAFVRAVVQSLQQGYAYAEAHPPAAWQALHEADRSLQPRLVMPSLLLLRSAVTDAPTIGYQSGSQWARYGRWLWAHRLISRPVDVAQAFTDRFLAPRIR